MQVPHCGEVVDGEVEAGEAFDAIGTELASEHEEGVVVHHRLLELPRWRVEVEACDRQWVEGTLLLKAADEFGVRLLADLFPAVEPLAGVGLEKPDEERLAVTPAAMEEEDLAERVVFVECSRERPNVLIAVGEKTQRTRPFGNGWLAKYGDFCFTFPKNSYNLRLLKSKHF